MTATLETPRPKRVQCASTALEPVIEMPLVELIPELLLTIASFLPQEDLLNISLTCTRLRNVTQSQLYREYINPNYVTLNRGGQRSLKSFVFRLLSQPELTKYVHRVDLKQYQHFADLHPDFGPPEETPRIDCNSEDYQRLTDAALSVGVITEVLPYEIESSICKKLNENALKMEIDADDVEDWPEKMYDDNIETPEVRYDIQFCKLLRFGLEEP